MTSIDLTCLALVIAILAATFAIARVFRWHRCSDYWFARYIESTSDCGRQPTRSPVSIYSEGPVYHLDVDALPVEAET